MGVTFIGPYYVDADGSGKAYHLPDWITGGLTIGTILEGKTAPYRIDHNGVPIGWAKRSAFIVGPLSQLKKGVVLKIQR